MTLLIFIGIHNAWDVVTFLATGKAERLPDEPSTSEQVPVAAGNQGRSED